MPLFPKKTAKPKAASLTTTLDHPVLGEVIVARSRRARRISISVRPPARVRLTVPWGVAASDAVAFLQSKEDWVLQAKERVAARAPSGEPIEMPFRTREHELCLDPAAVEKITVRVAGGEIRVRYPLDRPPTSEPVQEAIRKGIERAWKAEAEARLPDRLAELAREHGLKYRSVALRNTRSRWGSCSAKDDISLSIRLMRLPDELVDYILLHELAHTVHKNHGPRFHTLLDRLTAGRHAELRRRMKAFR